MNKKSRVCSLVAFLLLIAWSFPAYSQDKWEVFTTIDGFTDGKIVSAQVLSEDLNGFIHAVCRSRVFEMKISTGKYIGDLNISRNVKYRIDKDTHVNMTMRPSNKRYVYMNDMDSQFIKDLMRGDSSVLIQTTSFNYDTSKAKFTLKGSTNALKTVLDACGWIPVPHVGTEWVG